MTDGTKTKVVIETRYAGDITANISYARACMLDSLKRGEAPFLSHLLYTQVLDDAIQEERKMGIDAGLHFARVCDKTVVYTDLGISEGMRIGIQDAIEQKRPVEYRSLPGFRIQVKADAIAAEIWGIGIEELDVKLRKREVVEARMVLMEYHYNQGKSTTQSAQKYGLKYGAVGHAKKTINSLKEVNRDFRRKYEAFYERINFLR